MHPQELTDGIQHVTTESRLGENPRTINQSMCTDVIIGVDRVVIGKTAAAVDPQRTREYTKADNSLRLRPNLRPLLPMKVTTILVQGVDPPMGIGDGGASPSAPNRGRGRGRVPDVRAL